MADQVIIRRAGHQELDTLDAADIPALAYDADGAAATAASGAASALSSHEADTTSIHGIANTANLYAVGGTDVAVADGGTGAGTSAGARTNLGLVIGTDVRAQGSGDPTLASLGAAPADAPYLVTTANAGLSAEVVVPAAVLTVLDDTTVAAMVDTLGGASSTGTGGLVRATSPTLVTPALGTPASGVATNLTGTAAGLTAGLVTTNANLTGDVTSSGNATTLATVPVAKGGTGGITALAARANLGAGSGAIRGLLPAGALYHTFDRQDSAVNLGLLATGRLSILMIEMDAGVTINSITFVSGTTALSVGVNQWFALFDSSRAKLAVTVDDTSTAWIANKDKTLNLSAPFLTTYTGIYFLGIMVKATTVPSLIVANAHATLAAVVLPITGGNSTTGLTDPASCPNPAGAIAGGVGFPYAWVS